MDLKPGETRDLVPRYNFNLRGGSPLTDLSPFSQGISYRVVWTVGRVGDVGQEQMKRGIFFRINTNRRLDV